MNSIGLDIGTTSICICVVDINSGEMINSTTFANKYVAPSADYEKCQDPDAIIAKCVQVIDEFIETYSPVCTIGITGQMHGIVYVDKLGNAISNLYTWQDASGNELIGSNETYTELLSRITGYPMASGFGCSTLFCHTKKNIAPANTARICTIHDYAAMKLCGLSEPIMHSSDAASFGLFDLLSNDFDKTAIKKAGLDISLFPKVISSPEIIGKHNNIPVCIAIGDNQASFIGSVKNTSDSILINIGTGSQISFLTKRINPVTSTEIRPYNNNDYLRVGSALCGGRAFALMEKFIRETINLADKKIDNAYQYIDAYLNSSSMPESPLEFRTTFCGTRERPNERASITNIGLDNFTPGHMIYGILQGITDELLTMYKECGEENHRLIVGSGNGLRKNFALQKIISESLDMELKIPAHKEEAAYGAVLYSLTAAGIFNSLKESQMLIKYQ